ncbi:MAG: 50S ribosomal protein L25 [Thermoguttaceae bacterium]|jgi:large subunit ribosomal protein L25|nr:50S ribosomal protein L25 [Thermoguttaceae bacterium]
MAEVLHVEARETRGKRDARRQRRSGKIPAVLYGHGQETLSLTLSAEEFDAAMRHGARLVRLTGAVDEQAFVRELQWDTWGTHVLHVDFTRVSEHERVRVEVPVELRGEAPGVKAGGVIKQAIHQIEIECEATAIPDKIHVSINRLELGQQITVGQIELPPTVKILADPTELVVECHEPVEVAEEAAAPAEGEPEVIGRKKEEGEEETEE